MHVYVSKCDINVTRMCKIVYLWKLFSFWKFLCDADVFKCMCLYAGAIESLYWVLVANLKITFIRRTNANKKKQSKSTQSAAESENYALK